MTEAYTGNPFAKEVYGIMQDAGFESQFRTMPVIETAL